MSENKIKSISMATIEALLTHPENTFTGDDIYNQVKEVLGRDVSKRSVLNYAVCKFVKEGIVEPGPGYQKYKKSIWKLTMKGPELLMAKKASAGNRTWEKPPAGQVKNKKAAKKNEAPAGSGQIDTLELGNAIVAKICDYQQTIKDMQAKLVDAGVVHKSDVQAYKQIIAEKDNTIRELKRDVERYKTANNVKRRTVPLSEVAIFRPSKYI